MGNEKAVIVDPFKMTQSEIELMSELALKQKEETIKALTDLIDSRIDKRMEEIVKTIELELRYIQMELMLQPERDRTMKAGSWEIIGGMNTVRDEYVVIGYDPKSPTPYGTWVGTIRDGIGNFNWGHYFESRETAWNDLNERLKNRI